MGEASNTLGRTAGTNTFKRVFIASFLLLLSVGFSFVCASPAWAVGESVEPQVAVQQARPNDSQAADDFEGPIAVDDMAQASDAERPRKEECILDEDTPLALIPTPGYWSLADVLAAIVSTLAALALFVGAMQTSFDDCGRQTKRQKKDGSRDRRTPLVLLICGLSVAVMAMSGLLITQDFAEPMALFDTWSPAFATGAVVNIVLVMVDVRRRHDIDDGTSASMAATA